MRPAQVWLLVLAVGVLAGTEGPAQQARETQGEGTRPGVDLLWGEKVPMRDGIRLNATVYRPSRQAGPLPAIFTFTPYISDTYHPRAMYFAEHGYVFALVDVRGRGNSEGSFEPFVHEGKDGHDVVEWLARQPWCDGKVTMWGGSYAGFDQWSVLKEFPPHLVTIVPAAAAHAAVDFPFFKNIFSSYIIQWLTYTSGVTGNGNLFGQSSFWIQKFSEMYMGHRPFSELDRIAGNTSTVFQKWLQHPIPDGYWDAMSPAPADYRNIDMPILTITGHYDGDQAGALTYYQRHMQYGTPAARDRHYLIIGPWDHAGTRTPARQVGGLVFGEASMVDLNRLHREWYDWTMKSGARPEFLKKRVAYYVVGPGAEEWKYADTLEGIGKEAKTLYLASEGGQANDTFHSGFLRAEKQGESMSDQYTYDPLDTRPAELEKDEIRNSITDQRFALNFVGNGVVYHSDPFAQATEISGYVRLAVWMALDVPDTDFQATLYEILPDGTSVMLTGDMLRARYRESLTREKLVSAGEVNRYDFTDFTWFSRRVSKRSRLRLVLSSPNSIQLEKNYNSGGIVAAESGKEARTAHVRVYHDAGHPSALQIPVVAPPNP